MENTGLNFAALIIPLFLLFTGLEYLYARRHGKKALLISTTITIFNFRSSKDL